MSLVAVEIVYWLRENRVRLNNNADTTVMIVAKSHRTIEEAFQLRESILYCCWDRAGRLPNEIFYPLR